VVLLFVKTGSSLLISFTKFSHMFCDLSYTKLTQLNSNTEKLVPDWFQQCSQINTSRTSERNCHGLVANFYDNDIVKLVQCLDK
jgi:hypothetical protein